MKKIVLGLILLVSVSFSNNWMDRHYPNGFNYENASQIEMSVFLCEAQNQMKFCRNAGFLYARGTGGAKKNEKKAIKYLVKACRGGDKDACDVLKPQ